MNLVMPDLDLVEEAMFFHKKKDREGDVLDQIDRHTIMVVMVIIFAVVIVASNTPLSRSCCPSPILHLDISLSLSSYTHACNASISLPKMKYW